MMVYLFIMVLLLGCLFLGYLLLKKRRVDRVADMLSRSGRQDGEMPSPLLTKKDAISTQTEKALAATSLMLKSVRYMDESGPIKIVSSLFLISLMMVFDDLLNWEMTFSNLLLSALMVIILVIIVPGYIRKFIIGRQIRNIENDMPLFVDLLAICVQSGMTIESSLKFLSENIGKVNKSFVPFLDRLVKKMNVNGLDSGLIQLKQELPSVEISMLCTTLQQSLKYGTSIYSTLMELSTEMRELQLLRTEEAIGKLSAKMSVPLILFFMFPVIIIIAAPGMMRVMGQMSQG